MSSRWNSGQTDVRECAETQIVVAGSARLEMMMDSSAGGGLLHKTLSAGDFFGEMHEVPPRILSL
eukprot:1450654-Rhodomonas_salina.1